MCAYPYESPWRVELVVAKMPDKVRHDRSDDQARYELEESKSVEWDLWVVARCRFGTALEWFDHLVNQKVQDRAK